jgi:hypothetical protein
VGDWIEWDQPWTDQVWQETADLETALSALTFKDLGMKTSTPHDENQPLLGVSPRLGKRELERLTLGGQGFQTEQSWQELATQVRDKAIPDAWRVNFGKEVSLFEHGDVEDQLEAIGALVELMMIVEDSHRMVEGSWDDQNSPLNMEPFSSN